tara:strand:- start:2767 stop:2985 length:219 start_codon:yes stop_codon:yes gene_type:complete
MPPKKIKFNIKNKAPAPAKKAPAKKGISDAEFKKLVASTNKLMEDADLQMKEMKSMKADIAERKKKIKNYKR